MYADPFTDTTPVMTPELYDPNSRTFSVMAPIASIRNYHSVALLLPDASIMIGGGGLCGNCSTNKFDAQIYYPWYFYTTSGGPSNRPVISSISASTLRPGQTITLTTTAAITRFALVRYGSATHALDTDQRRVPLEPTKVSGTTYRVTIPNDTGIVIPGAWMLFAVANSIPSISKTVMISN
jgi:galactose oxidase